MQYAAAAAAAAARMDMFGGQALNNGNGSQPQHHHHHHDGLPPLPPLAYMGMPMPPLPPMPGMFDPRTMDMARMMDHSMQSKAVASMMKDNTSAMSAPRHDFNHGLLPPPPSQPQPQPQPQQQPPPPQQAQTMHPENNETAAQQQLPGGASLPMSMVGQSAVDNAAVQTKAVTPIMKNASAPAADRTKPGSTSKAPSPQSMDYEGGGEETAPTTTANNSNTSTVTSNPYICWCPICGEKFETFQKLGEHQQVHANHGVGPTPSPHGGEAPPPTTTAAVAAPATHGPYLRQHQMLYPDAMAIAKPFRCHDCGKHFTQIAHLNVHMRIHRNEKPYECTICKKAFTQFSHLKAHERIHTGEKPYKCQHCGKQFKQSQQLQTHVRVHTGERPYSCSICGKGFAQSPHLQTHIRLHTGERPYKCNVCNKQFTQSQHLRAHQRTHGIDKPHVCEICNETFTYAMSLVTHMQSVHQMINRRTYECSMCGKKFHQKHLLENHMTLHTGLGPYKCDQCSMEFADMEDLVGHMKQHVDAAAAIAAATAAATAAIQMPIRPTMSTSLIADAKANAGKEDTMNRHQPSLSTLECVKPKVELHTMQCGRGMDQIRPEYKSLQPIPSQEMDMKQGNLPPVASMSACFPGFPNQPLAGLSAIEAPAALRSAIEEEIAKINSQPLDQGRLVIADGANQSRRSPIRPYKCDVCDKAFTQQTNLTMHKRIHTGERPYSCTLCDKHFTQSQHLYMHMRIHTGEKPHRCRFCRKEFTRIETLHAHERVHTGEKPFCCQYCQKTFRQSQQLKTHERVHTGERPYKCDYCGKGFAQSSHLRSHNRIHTGERPYKCNMCSKEFKQSTHLMSHRRGHLARDPSLLAVFDKSREEIQALRAQNQLPQEDKMDDEEMLMCTECGDEFFDQRELEEHQKTHVKEKSNVGPNGSPHRGSESPSSVKNDNLDSLSTRSSSPAASESSHESESEESTNNISDHADSDTEDEDEQKSAASNSSSEDEGRMGANRAPKSATTAVPQFNNDMNNGTLDPQGQNPGSSKFKVSVNSEFLEQNNTPSVQYNPGALDKWYVQNRTENDS